MKNLKALIFITFLSIPFSSMSQGLEIQLESDPQVLSENFLGSGVEISNVEIDCPGGAVGIFDGTNSNLGISNGILLTSGAANNAIGPNNSGSISTSNGAPGDADLNTLIAQSTNDACVLEFDFVAVENTLTFNYVFGSEEYLEYVDSFNDVFAFFISGPGINGLNNVATIPGGNLPVSINSINDQDNSILYINNGDGINNVDITSTVQYDGFTTVLSSTIVLVPCGTYHIKIAIADAGDSALDSGVFLEGGSFNSEDADGCPVQTLDNLEENYLESIGTLKEDYAAQYFCIASNTCAEFEENGADGWANGFVRYVWEFFESRNDGPVFYDTPCIPIPNVPDFMEEYLCFAQEGVLDHYFTEMAPAFFSYCSNCNSEDQDQWDTYHNGFLEEAVLPCFNDFIDMPDFLSCSTGETTVFLASLLRELSQVYCEPSDYLVNSTDVIESFVTDFVLGNYCCQPDLIGIVDPLNPIICNAGVIVDVGNEVIDVIEDFGSWLNPWDDNLIPAGYQAAFPQQLEPVYFIDLDPQYYQIVNNTLTITGSPSPYAGFSEIVNVFCMNGDTLSIVQQFIIIDADSDGDLLGDTYEESIGLDPLVPNTVDTDQDGDGLNDYFEAVIQSNPLSTDSDGDGFTDDIEVAELTDYNNANNFPGSFSCSDGVLNGNEESIDCGGDCPDACTIEDYCNDGIQNNDEEGIDCGGVCENSCLAFTLSEIDPCSCSNFIDVDNNGTIDYLEHLITYVDGTGPYTVLSFSDNYFDENANPLSITDLSTLFNDSTVVSIYIPYGSDATITGVDVLGEVDNLGLGPCTSCTCFDGIQNGDETGIDCGGSCPTLCDGELDVTCNTTVLDFTDSGVNWSGDAQNGALSYPDLDFSITIDDPSGIIVNTDESAEGIQIGIDPNDASENISITYSFSESVNFVQFKVKELEYINPELGESNQHEAVTIYGLVNNSPGQIYPTIQSYDGSVSVSGNYSEGTTDSNISNAEESILVTFNRCVDEVIIIYGTSIESAIVNPANSQIQIGTELGFIAESCYPEDCGIVCGESRRLDFSKEGIDWVNYSLNESYDVLSQTYDISISDPSNTFISSLESGRGIKVRFDPADVSESISTTYSFTNVSSYTAFDIEDIEYKPWDMQREMVTIVGTLGDDIVLPTLYNINGSVEIDGNMATGMAASGLNNNESILVIFNQAIDGFTVIQSTGMDNDITDPDNSRIFIGRQIGVYTSQCFEVNCPVSITLDDMLLTDELYQAEVLLKSNSQVAENTSVTLQAGETIELNEGFEINENSTFSVKIDGCE